MTRKEIMKLVDDEVGSRPEAVRHFLDGLFEACVETSSHAEENWQDKGLARAWNRVATAIGSAKVKFDEQIGY
jgi:hypothetical protein